MMLDQNLKKIILNRAHVRTPFQFYLKNNGIKGERGKERGFVSALIVNENRAQYR